MAPGGPVEVAAARHGTGGLFMAKHRQNKATKKHVKERPRKTRPSDKNRSPPQYSVEVMTNGNFPGAPPVWELAAEPEDGIDTKASVIEARASAEWDAANGVETPAEPASPAQEAPAQEQKEEVPAEEVMA